MKKSSEAIIAPFYIFLFSLACALLRFVSEILILEISNEIFSNRFEIVEKIEEKIWGLLISATCVNMDFFWVRGKNFLGTVDDIEKYKFMGEKKRRKTDL